jgi:hypothetical protein
LKRIRLLPREKTSRKLHQLSRKLKRRWNLTMKKLVPLRTNSKTLLIKRKHSHSNKEMNRRDRISSEPISGRLTSPLGKPHTLLSKKNQRQIKQPCKLNTQL